MSAGIYVAADSDLGHKLQDSVSASEQGNASARQHLSISDAGTK